MISVWMLSTCVPTAPWCDSWCSGWNIVLMGTNSVCPKPREKSQSNSSIARRRLASGIGAMAYMARCSVDMSRLRMSGWSIISRYMTGSAKMLVMRSRSMSSSSPAQSNPRMRTIVPPTYTVGTLSALSCATWNSGIIAAMRVSFVSLPSNTDVTAPR